MTRWWNDLICLFFPRLCLLCQKPLVEGERLLCTRCLCDLPYTGYERKADNPTKRLFIGKADIERASSFLRYEKGGAVQRLIHSFKYHGNKELAFLLGRMAALECKKQGLFGPIDMLLPVPLHPRKKRQRGYNQAEWIARGFSTVFSLPIDTQSLRCVKQTDTQTHRQVYERWLNTQGVFKISDNQLLKGKNVLLIDDVITTGSTLLACAEELSKIENIRIHVLTIASV